MKKLKIDINTHKNNLYKPKNQEKMLGQYESYLIQPSKTINKSTKKRTVYIIW